MRKTKDEVKIYFELYMYYCSQTTNIPSPLVVNFSPQTTEHTFDFLLTNTNICSILFPTDKNSKTKST